MASRRRAPVGARTFVQRPLPRLLLHGHEQDGRAVDELLLGTICPHQPQQRAAEGIALELRRVLDAAARRLEAVGRALERVLEARGAGLGRGRGPRVGVVVGTRGRGSRRRAGRAWCRGAARRRGAAQRAQQPRRPSHAGAPTPLINPRRVRHPGPARTCACVASAASCRGHKELPAHCGSSSARRAPDCRQDIALPLRGSPGSAVGATAAGRCARSGARRDVRPQRWAARGRQRRRCNCAAVAGRWVRDGGPAVVKARRAHNRALGARRPPPPPRWSACRSNPGARGAPQPRRMAPRQAQGDPCVRTVGRGSIWELHAAQQGAAGVQERNGAGAGGSGRPCGRRAEGRDERARPARAHAAGAAAAGGAL
jgi:hypothetical protein